MALIRAKRLPIGNKELGGGLLYGYKGFTEAG